MSVDTTEKRASAALKRWAAAHPEECKRRAQGNGGKRGAHVDSATFLSRLQDGPALDCYDDVVAHCRGCKNISRDKCRVFRCPENIWYGRRGRCARYELEVSK